MAESSGGWNAGILGVLLVSGQQCAGVSRHQSQRTRSTGVQSGSECIFRKSCAKSIAFFFSSFVARFPVRKVYC